MGEINTNNSAKKTGAAGNVKHRTTRVDLTPMVDLGFILITFFILTSVITQAKAMQILMPNDTEVDITEDVAASAVITLMPGAHNKLHYFEGDEKTARVYETDYAATGLRKILSDKKKKLFAQFNQNKMVVIIRPGNESCFKNMVDIIDECNICMVKRYYIEEQGTGIAFRPSL